MACLIESSIVLAAQPPIGLYVSLGVVVLLLLWAIAAYNGLVRTRNHCHESWADVETELKRRYDLIPNLVETVKGYAKHEQETLQKAIEARNQAATPHSGPTAQARDENQLSSAIRGVMFIAEDYPDLKASRHFLALQQELATTENRIQRARRFYNANCRDLANKIEMFPSSVMAKMYGFRKREYFEIDDDAERAVPKVDV